MGLSFNSNGVMAKCVSSPVPDSRKLKIFFLYKHFIVSIKIFEITMAGDGNASFPQHYYAERVRASRLRISLG